MKNLIYLILISLFLLSCSSDKKEFVVEGVPVERTNLKCDFQMYYNPKLANKLELVLKNLKRNRFNYDWYKQSSCNTGCVARILLDKYSDNDIENCIDPYYSPLEKIKKEAEENGQISPSITWSYTTNYYCPVGQMYLPEIFYNLSVQGLSPEEITDLEYLRNPCILKRTNINISEDKYFTKQENLIKYLEVWITILKDKNNPPYKNNYKLRVIKHRRNLSQKCAEGLSIPITINDTLNID